jgi:steroid delta-isomerase-like uncharacterized protein
VLVRSNSRATPLAGPLSVRDAERWQKGGDELMTHTDASTPSLQAFLDAFNDHDIEAIMSFFTDDCVFDTPRGPAPGGHRMVGREEVRKGIQARFDGIPDIQYGDDRHWTCGDRGVSEWTIRGTKATGESIEVRGCDLFEFTHGKISRKDSFWKIVE